MYCQMRTRMNDTFSRFRANIGDPGNHYTVANTARHLNDLINAIKSLTKPANWRVMSPTIRLQYFGLVLEVLRNVVAHDTDHRPTRSSPYAVDSAMDYNLYLRMVSNGQCAHAMFFLHGLFNRLQSPLAQPQADQVGSMLRKVEEKRDKYLNSRLKNVEINSKDFVDRLSGLSEGELIGCDSLIFVPTDIVTDSYFRQATPLLMPLLACQRRHLFLAQTVWLEHQSSRLSSRPHEVDYYLSLVMVKLVSCKQNGLFTQYYTLLRSSSHGKVLQA